mmetsp:Transcript_16503/g.29347  ORF Transcript_16503/g.29347 Transcript_16503/m.29347 type:complete len:763 (-) Transcript_16503:1103-3391(-)
MTDENMLFTDATAEVQATDEIEDPEEAAAVARLQAILKGREIRKALGVGDPELSKEEKAQRIAELRAREEARERAAAAFKKVASDKEALRKACPYVYYREETTRHTSTHWKVPKMKYLHFKLIEGIVPAMDLNGKSDPFVVVDTGMQRWKSNTIDETLLPIWDQDVVLGVIDPKSVRPDQELPEDLKRGYVDISCWDQDVAQDDTIATLKIPFKKIPGYFQDVEEADVPVKWYTLEQEESIVDDFMGSGVGKFLQSIVGTEEEEPKKKTAKDRWRMVQTSVKKKGRVHEFEGKHDKDARGQGSCRLKFAIWFDHNYLPNTPSLIGQIKLQLKSCFLEKRENKKNRRSMMVLQYNDYWVRTHTDENQYALYDNRFTFGVLDPSHVITVAVFDDRSDLLIPSGPKYLGKFRIRPCTLALNKPVHTTQPIMRIYGDKVKQVGKVELTVTFEGKTLPVVAAMFRPPLKDHAYWHPIGEEGEKQIEECYKQRVAEFLVTQKGELRLEEDVLEPILDEKDKTFNMLTFKAHIQRIVEGLGPLGKAVSHFDDICEWKNFNYSLKVNIYVALAIWYAKFLPHLCLILLTRKFLQNWCVPGGPGRVVAPMDPSLYGGLVDEDNNKKQDKDKAPKKNSDGEEDEGNGSDKENEEAEKDEEDEEEEVVEKKGGIFDEYKQMMTLLTTIQDGIGSAAGVLERLSSLHTWEDPRISGLITVIFFIVLMFFNYLPLRIILVVVALFVMRHPKLRDPIPPPPVNLVERLPSRQEKML